MSAIYGIINKSGKPVDPEIVQRMKQAMQHRAKDGSKELICDNAAFGFCHLVVYPNQEHEQLPIQDGDLLFTANAHLHNRDELVNKLGLDKLQYAKTPDSYLILEAYKKWGADSVHHLDGEYVYAAWNRTSQELFISNDHIGYKALYYYDTPEQFIFCSEIKGIEVIPSLEKNFDDSSLIEFLFKQGEPSATYNKSIKSLGGGNNILIKNGALEKQRFWNFQPLGKYKFHKPDEWFECMRDLLWKAVEDRANTSQEIGITLSGGLDSGSVASILCNILKKKNKSLYAFSSALPSNYRGEKTDEKSFIESIGKKYDNIIQTYVSADQGSPFEEVERAMKLDECIPNYFHYMDFALLQEAKEKNVGVLFSGFGGDYWASSKGNRIIYNYFKNFQLLSAYNTIRFVAKVESLPLSQVFKKEYLAYTGIIKAYVKRKQWDFLPYLTDSFGAKFPGLDYTSTLEIMPRLINNGKISRLAGIFDNRNAMFGIEAATPFFDRNLLEFLADVPTSYHIYKGYKRSLIRNAMEGILPNDIQWRLTKSPYVIDHWERYQSNKNTLHKLITQIEEDHLMHKYFKTEELKSLLSKFDPSAVNEHTKIIGLRIYMLAICYISLREFKKNGYCF